MAKSPPVAPIDYESQWNTYNRWNQEDLQWRENQKELYAGGGNLIRAEESKMNREGIQRGSNPWRDRIEAIEQGVPDYEQEYQDRQAKLKDSALFETLFRSNDAPIDRLSLIYDQTEENTRATPKGLDTAEGWAAYEKQVAGRATATPEDLQTAEGWAAYEKQVASEKSTAPEDGKHNYLVGGGRLPYGDEAQAQMEQQYAEMFDTETIDNIYKPSAEEQTGIDAADRARASAGGGIGGRNKAALQGSSDEGSPWI